MKDYNYIAIIRKAEFIDLYKFGYAFVDNIHVKKFTGSVNELKSDVLFQKLFSSANPFDYTFEYLVIHFSRNKRFATDKKVCIEEVRSVYALDEEARKELEVSLDSRIQIQSPPWGNCILDIQMKNAIESCKDGINNIWRIFGLDEQKRKTNSQIIKDDDIKEIVRQLYVNERPKGEMPIWIYLLRYERHNVYPRDMRGFFIDAVHVFCNFYSKEEHVEAVAEETDIYKLIYNLQEQSYGKICEMIRLKAENYIQKTDSFYPNFYKIAPLFLYLKSEFSEGLDNHKKYGIVPISFEHFANYLKSLDEFYMVAYLLGITLGYDKTYDCLYDILPLPIFKKQLLKNNNLDSDVAGKEPLHDRNLKKHSEKSQGLLFEDSISSHSASFKKTMVNKDGVQKYAKTQNELDDYLEKGWSKGGIRKSK